ncbi:MAG: zinc ribbon domain-containing protein [Candidatus Dojkabacteria bacterium]|nr:zinc ribbon domain-containing protein [Candidatus Dojkabacteria bacterium]
MPIYDYQCLDCASIQEVEHPMSGPTQPLICQRCSSSRLKKLVSSPYVKFVGDWQTNQVRNIPPE